MGSGGRGRLRGGGNDGVILRGKARTIETTYIESHGWSRASYKSEVLEATSDGNGNVVFAYATPVSDEKTAKTNKTHYVTYKVKAGAEDGDIFGVDLSKAKSVSGQTYGIKDTIKRAGFRWDGKNKRWVK